jgi:hypothetical protein
MATNKGSDALLMILGGKKKPDGPDSAPETSSGSDYDEDLKAALSDLAAALGVEVKDAERGIEALKAAHDLCARMDGED